MAGARTAAKGSHATKGESATLIAWGTALGERQSSNYIFCGSEHRQNYAAHGDPHTAVLVKPNSHIVDGKALAALLPHLAASLPGGVSRSNRALLLMDHHCSRLDPVALRVAQQQGFDPAAASNCSLSESSKYPTFLHTPPILTPATLGAHLRHSITCFFAGSSPLQPQHLALVVTAGGGRSNLTGWCWERKCTLKVQISQLYCSALMYQPRKAMRQSGIEWGTRLLNISACRCLGYAAAATAGATVPAPAPGCAAPATPAATAAPSVAALPFQHALRRLQVCWAQGIARQRRRMQHATGACCSACTRNLLKRCATLLHPHLRSASWWAGRQADLGGDSNQCWRHAGPSQAPLRAH